MPCFQTKNFAAISYETDAIVEFPNGLAGFEERRLFLALQFEDSAPLVFLQSLEDPGLCFITLPVLVVDREYRLQVSAEDRELVGLPAARGLRMGEDVGCFAVISIREGSEAPVWTGTDFGWPLTRSVTALPVAVVWTALVGTVST